MALTVQITSADGTVQELQLEPGAEIQISAGDSIAIVDSQGQPIEIAVDDDNENNVIVTILAPQGQQQVIIDGIVYGGAAGEDETFIFTDLALYIEDEDIASSISYVDPDTEELTVIADIEELLAGISTAAGGAEVGSGFTAGIEPDANDPNLTDPLGVPPQDPPLEGPDIGGTEQADIVAEEEEESAPSAVVATGLVDEAALGPFVGDFGEGEVEVVGSAFGEGATDGESMALLHTDGEGAASQLEIEAFLGLAPGALDTLNDGDAVAGQAIKRALSVEAGDVITFDFNFIAGDFLFNDFGFVTINGEAVELADVISVVGSGSSSGFQTFTFTATESGSLVIGMGVMNDTTTVLDSHLLIDNLRINDVLVDNGSFESGDLTGWAALPDNVAGHDGTDANSSTEATSGLLGYDFGDSGPAAETPFVWSTTVTADADDDSDFESTDPFALTSGGDPIIWTLEGDDPLTLIGTVVSDGEGPNADTLVARLVVTDVETGAYTFTLRGPIDHPDDASVAPGGGEIGLDDLVNLKFNYTVTDGSGGTTAGGTLNITVTDDGPLAFMSATGDTVTLDETINPPPPPPPREQLPPSTDDCAPCNPCIPLTDLPDDDIGCGNPDPFAGLYGSAIGAVSDVDMVDTATITGADGEGASTVVSLNVLALDSGLATTDGTTINLFEESNGDVTGRAGGESAEVIFAISRAITESCVRR